MTQTFKSVSPSPASCPYIGPLGCSEEMGRVPFLLTLCEFGVWSCQSCERVTSGLFWALQGVLASDHWISVTQLGDGLVTLL